MPLEGHSGMKSGCYWEGDYPANDISVVQRLLATLRGANVRNPEYAAIEKILKEGVDGRFLKSNV